MTSKDQLFQAAALARKNAYAPYSRFLVGAALTLDSSEQIFSGCNIENISYGATLCAERTAIVKAISEFPKSRITQLALVTDSETHDAPCGNCLQVINEFCSADTPIHLCNLNGVQKTVPFAELMPYRFEADLSKF